MIAIHEPAAHLTLDTSGKDLRIIVSEVIVVASNIAWGS